MARFGGLDFLINNAGVGVFADVAVDDAGAVGRGHRHQPHRRVQRLPGGVPHLRRRGGGYIINISSLAGKNPFKGAGAYCASKAGLNAFSEVLMQEVRYDNIRVSYVMPGSVATGFSSGDETQGRRLEERRRTMSPPWSLDLLRSDPRSIQSRVESGRRNPRSSPPATQSVGAKASAERSMSVFDKHRDTLEHHETKMGTARGRLAVAMDLLTDSLALVGQHGVYCRSDRFPGKPKMDIALVLEQLDDAKQLVQSAMENSRRLNAQTLT